MSEPYSMLYGPDGAKILFKGKELTEPKDIIDFIDAHMKPSDLDLQPNPEELWENMRAMHIFQMLLNENERTAIYVESIGTGKNLASVILCYVKERYPDLYK